MKLLRLKKIIKMEGKYQCINIVGCQNSINLSRQTLLKWIEDDLGVTVKKVEDLCSGAVYCQFMANLFPGCIPLKNIKFEARLQTEYWSNLKQLQKAFLLVGCEKDVPIARLIEGRFQENFQFLQWFKRYYDANLESFNEVFPKNNTPAPLCQDASQPGSSRNCSGIPDVVASAVHQNEEKIKRKIAEYALKGDAVCKERDFYFSKLRRIEILCAQEGENCNARKELVSKILAKLCEENKEEE